MECSLATKMLHPRHRQGVLGFPDMPRARLAELWSQQLFTIMTGRAREQCGLCGEGERTQGLSILTDLELGPWAVAEPWFIYL